MKGYEIYDPVLENSKSFEFEPLRLPEGADSWSGIDAEIARGYAESGIIKYNKRMLKAFDEAAELADGSELQAEPYVKLGITEDSTADEIIEAWRARS